MLRVGTTFIQGAPLQLCSPMRLCFECLESRGGRAVLLSTPPDLMPRGWAVTRQQPHGRTALFPQEPSVLPWLPLGLFAHTPPVRLSSQAHSRTHLLTLWSDTLSHTRKPRAREEQSPAEGRMRLAPEGVGRRGAGMRQGPRLSGPEHSVQPQRLSAYPARAYGHG